MFTIIYVAKFFGAPIYGQFFFMEFANFKSMHDDIWQNFVLVPFSSFFASFSSPGKNGKERETCEEGRKIANLKFASFYLDVLEKSRSK